MVKAALAAGGVKATVGDPPEMLTEAARAVWVRVAEASPWLEAGDRDVFAGFCSAVARFAEAEAAIAKHGLTYETVNGGVGTRPEVRTSIQCAGLIRSLGSELGLTPAGRTRMMARPNDAVRASDLPPELRGGTAKPAGA
jgi:P27 family predicted phage terminase small subunit